MDDTDALDEARSAFYAAAASSHWRVYWYVDKILDDALERMAREGNDILTDLDA